MPLTEYPYHLPLFQVSVSNVNMYALCNLWIPTSKWSSSPGTDGKLSGGLRQMTALGFSACVSSALVSEMFFCQHKVSPCRGEWECHAKHVLYLILELASIDCPQTFLHEVCVRGVCVRV